ncbi:unnamed protein product [Allacma fusca]|uniref:Dynein heavy chain n=1 Tax=Allacma fusca TaxID=39272 RepID=A0A8J2PTT9_9HEXA|nr:unnamed protein product [Allacma fusca]
MSLLSTFYSKEILEEKDYLVSPSGKYYVPENASHTSCMQYIRKLPLNPNPEVFGLHFNANITKGNQETAQLLSRALLTQTNLSSSIGDGVTSTDHIIVIAKDILSKLPKRFDMESIEEKFPLDYMNSMNTVLRQELIRFNRLIRIVQVTLKNIQKAIKGFVVMSLELDEVASSMRVGKVPQAWATRSYPSLKPLGSYVLDLLARLNFFQTWIDNGAPTVFWLSGFYFTQSFLTGVLQNFARRYKIPIDHLGFEYEVTALENSSNVADDVDTNEEDNVMVDGLFLEGARWDREVKLLAEPKPNILYDTLPIILLKPGVKTKFLPMPAYDSPVYKTSARQGTLSTTGHSTNFVLYLKLSTDLPQKHWINRGTACLCQLDD